MVALGKNYIYALTNRICPKKIYRKRLQGINNSYPDCQHHLEILSYAKADLITTYEIVNNLIGVALISSGLIKSFSRNKKRSAGRKLEHELIN